MKQSSVFATLLTIAAALLGCQGAPARPTFTPVKSSSSNTNTITQSKSFIAMMKMKLKLTKKKPELSSCNTTDVKPPSFTSVEIQLYSERRYVIQITQDGHINGTTLTQPANPWAVFLLESVGDGGLFRAKGIKANMYLSMDKRGRFYGRKNPNSESVFKKKRATHGFTAFQSYKYCSKYIGMKRNGHLKRTDRLNHSTHFLLVPNIKITSKP